MRQTTYLPFVRGIQDADADSADTQNGKLADACNVHVHPERANVLSLRPRFVGKYLTADANTRVTNAGDRPAFTLTSSIGTSALFRLGDDGAYGAIPTSSKWFSVDSIEKVTIRGNDAIFSQGYAQQANGDSIVVVSQGSFASGYRTYYQVSYNGQRLPEIELGTSNASAPGRLWVFARSSGSGWVVFFASGANIAVAFSTSSTGAFSAPVSIGAAAGAVYDIVPDGSGAFAIVLAAASELRFTRINESGGVVQAAFTVLAKATPVYAGIVQITAGTYHVWSGGYPVDANDTLYVHRVVQTGPVVTSLGSVVTALTVASASRITVGGGSIKLTISTTGLGSYCYLSGGNGQYVRVGRLFLCDNTSITQSTFTAPILPMGRIWCDTSFFGARIWGTQAIVAGCWELTPTSVSTNTVVRCVPIAYLTVTGANLAIDLSDPIRQFCCLHGVDASKCTIPSKEYAVSLVSIGYSLPTRASTVTTGGFDIMALGAPRYWDGVNMVPAGIPQSPIVDSVSVSPGTGTVPAGTYLYTLVWEWFDARGRRQQSAADLGTAVVASASSVILEIHPASIPYDERLLGTRPAMRGVVYRSDAGGTILKRGALYLEFTTVGPTSGLFGSTQFLVTDDGTVDFSTGEPLYTSAGGANELPATAMEECYLMRPYADRIIGVSKSFPDQLWYTKTLQVARGIEPNQALYFRLPEVASGLAVQDGNIYWFSETNCYAFLPQFADDTGAGGGGVDPVPLATGVGCMASNSIVETPVGVFFLGPRGPWVIPRGGGAPTFVGADVEEFFREFPTCRGAVYHPQFSEVVFAMEDTALSWHCIIIYNHISQQWYRWFIGDDAMATGGACITSLANIAYAGGTLAVAGIDSSSMEVLHLVDDYGAPSFITYDQFLVSDSREIHPYIETKNFMPSGGPAESFRADRLALDCAFTNGIVVSSSRTDGDTWDTGYSMPSTQTPIYRFPIQKCKSVRVRIYNTWNGQPVAAQGKSPVVYNGVTLYTSPLGRAKSASVSYRG